MSDPPGMKIEIDHHRYSTMLKLVSSIAIGESSPLFLEERVRELQGILPLLPMMVTWMAEAMDRVGDAKNGDIENDPEALRAFLLHNEMLCRSQGAVAALLCVAEGIRAQSIKEAKKPAKGKRNVRKKSADPPGDV